MPVINIIELRNYLIKAGSRDQFIQYFQKHFIASQNVLGAYTAGEFRIKSEPDRFFWIRGFKNMQARSQFLPNFYGGEIWKEFGPEANDMMLEWHNVYLLKPIMGSIDGLDNKKGYWVIDYFIARNQKADQLRELLAKNYVQMLHACGANNCSVWISEVTENDFPALPVYQQEGLTVVISIYRNEKEYESILHQLSFSNKSLVNEMLELVEKKNTLSLYPA